MIYQVLMRMIDRGNTQGLQEKIQALFEFGRLADTEYQTLLSRF